MCEKHAIDINTDLQKQLSVSARPLKSVYLAVLSIILSCDNSVGGKPSTVKQEQANNHFAEDMKTPKVKQPNGMIFKCCLPYIR